MTEFLDALRATVVVALDNAKNLGPTGPTGPNTRSYSNVSNLSQTHDGTHASGPSVPRSRDPVIGLDQAFADPSWIARTFFQHAASLARKWSSPRPPVVDDMIARCINRLGGWPRFVERVHLGDGSLESEFVAIFVELIRFKRPGGLLTRDRLPGLIGSDGSEATAYRWPEEEEFGEQELVGFSEAGFELRASG